METASLLQQVKQAEVSLNAQLESLTSHKVVDTIRALIKKDIAEVIEESPLQADVRERIGQLQLRLELLRNIRMHWKKFEKHAAGRGIQLRINQFSALQHLISFLETGKGQVGNDDTAEGENDLKRALMGFEVQPTGAGKTGAFAIESALLGVPTLILVPFDNLVIQTKKDLLKIGGFNEKDVGLVGTGAKEFGRFITVATYPGHIAEMNKNGEYAKHIQSKVKFCICDEVHTALGDRTQSSLEEIDGLGDDYLTEDENLALDAEAHVIKHLNELTSVKALKIGFTATPQLSQKHVRKYFPHFLGRVYHQDMVEAGILVPYRIVQCDGSVAEGEIGDHLGEELEIEILTREDIYTKLLGEYVDALKTYEKMKKKNSFPMRGMAFCTNHVECEKFTKQAEAVGLRCRIVTGREAKGKKGIEVIESAKDSLCRGEIDLIVTVEKLCAGFNFPEINAIIWARITSMAKTIQGVGRGGRSHQEDNRIKECCWVFETNWTLKNNAQRGRKPLRIADALAQNGEPPDDFCSMVNGGPLDYDDSYLNKVNNEDGTVDITVEGEDVRGLVLHIYAQSNKLNFARLLEYTKLKQLPIIGYIRGGSGKRVAVYRQQDVETLDYVKNHFAAKGKSINDKGVVNILCNNEPIEGIVVSEYTEENGINYQTLNKAITNASPPIKIIGKVRNGAHWVNIYSKKEIDELPYVKRALLAKGKNMRADGTISLVHEEVLTEGVAYIEYAKTIGVSAGTLLRAIESANPPVKIIGASWPNKKLRGSRVVEIYDKSQVDSLPLVIEMEKARKNVIGKGGTIEIDWQGQKRLGVGLSAYCDAHGINYGYLIKIIKTMNLTILGKAKSNPLTVDVYDKLEIDSIPFVKDRLKK